MNRGKKKADFTNLFYEENLWLLQFKDCMVMFRRVRRLGKDIVALFQSVSSLCARHVKLMVFGMAMKVTVVVTDLMPVSPVLISATPKPVKTLHFQVMFYAITISAQNKCSHLVEDID